MIEMDYRYSIMLSFCLLVFFAVLLTDFVLPAVFDWWKYRKK